MDVTADGLDAVTRKLEPIDRRDVSISGDKSKETKSKRKRSNKKSKTKDPIKESTLATEMSEMSEMCELVDTNSKPNVVIPDETVKLDNLAKQQKQITEDDVTNVQHNNYSDNYQTALSSDVAMTTSKNADRTSAEVDNVLQTEPGATLLETDHIVSEENLPKTSQSYVQQPIQSSDIPSIKLNDFSKKSSRDKDVCSSSDEDNLVRESYKKSKTIPILGNLKKRLTSDNLMGRQTRRVIPAPSKWKSVKADDVPSASKWKSVKHAVQISGMHKPKRHVDSFMENTLFSKKRFNTNRRVTLASTQSSKGLYESSDTDSNHTVNGKRVLSNKRSIIGCIKLSLPVDPDSTFIFYWLLVVTVAVEYNLWIQILRQAFTSVQKQSAALWFVLDGVADIAYILDIVVQFKTGYLDSGVLVTTQSQLTRHYIRSRYFAMDVLALIPLEFLYFIFGVQPLLRFPRFIKVYRVLQFNDKAENHAAHPNILRVFSLSRVLLLLCHWFAGFYFMISKAEGNTGSWTYNNRTEDFNQTFRQYLIALYWSTLTLTTIGDLPSPESNWQYLFQILSYLIGVFVFATIVGQVGNVINNYNSTRQEYEKLLDGAKLYMRKHDVPKEMQVRVQRWCDYAWRRGKVQGAMDINALDMLPDRLKTELALHVNLDILKQVTIFEDCEPEFLHDLVLKMQTCIFTPGDLVVRKGEVAREMFIIANGHLEVLSDKGKIVAVLSTGNFFGEIGLLNLDGGINRRTADVVSVGYSELFVLKRVDVVRAIKHYPTAKANLMKYAKKRLEEIRMQNGFTPKITLTPDSPIVIDPPLGANLSSHVTSLKASSLSPIIGRKLSRGSQFGSAFSIRTTDDDGDTNSMDDSGSDLANLSREELLSQLRKEIGKKEKEIKQIREKIELILHPLDAST